jgi:prenyltransferase beta subunit
MPYNLYSDFDPELHKQTFIHYLEVIIDENGKIMYAVPSHQEKMIKLACEKLNVTRDELNKMCPEEYYCDFMTWLSRVSGACSVWENRVMGDKFTVEQIKALQMLKDYGLYLGDMPNREENRNESDKTRSD